VILHVVKVLISIFFSEFDCLIKYSNDLLRVHVRYWEALQKWDEALQLTPNDEKLHEMRAQVIYHYPSASTVIFGVII